MGTRQNARFDRNGADGVGIAAVYPLPPLQHPGRITLLSYPSRSGPVSPRPVREAGGSPPTPRPLTRLRCVGAPSLVLGVVGRRHLRRGRRATPENQSQPEEHTSELQSNL